MAVLGFAFTISRECVTPGILTRWLDVQSDQSKGGRLARVGSIVYPLRLMRFSSFAEHETKGTGKWSLTQ